MGRNSRRGRYGVDAPYVPLIILGAALITVVVAVLTGAWAGFVLTALLILQAASYLHTSLRGKFAVWSDLLDDLRLNGDERLLDLGCGRGAVLLAAARRLPSGRACGVDLWRSVDQSGNAVEVTERNAELEGVAGRIELATADLRELPFPDEDFDLVVSSLAIHNVPSPRGRSRAVDEAVRVLRPGGRLVIADINAARAYARQLTELGLADVAIRGLGWRMWWGGPWYPTRLVTAVKPSRPLEDG